MNFTQPLPPSLDDCLDRIQSRTFRFFWDGAHPESGLPFDKCFTSGDPSPNIISVSGTGFGLLAIVVAAERQWVRRDEALERICKIIDHLLASPRFHGAFAHFIDGSTSSVIDFNEKDDGGDLVETTLLMQGLICAREYFSGATPAEETLRSNVTRLFDEVEWNWFTRGKDDNALYWHWSPDHDWIMNLPIRGWNEALSSYVLAAGSDTHPIKPESYHAGWARSGEMRNGNTYLGTTLPLGEPYGGPLFLAHYSFCVIDPRGLSDRYCDYWDQVVAHARINHDYCLSVPEYKDAEVWGLTASDGPEGYGAHSPTFDRGVIAPTAALASFSYLPDEAEKAMRAMLHYQDGKLLGRFGFADSFVPKTGWIAPTYLAIDQGPIIAMIENYRSGLLWRLFMNAPEVKRGLDRLEFTYAQPSV